MKYIDDRPCEVCGEFCESVTVESVVAGAYEFICTECDESNIFFSGSEAF